MEGFQQGLEAGDKPRFHGPQKSRNTDPYQPGGKTEAQRDSLFHLKKTIAYSVTLVTPDSNISGVLDHHWPRFSTGGLSSCVVLVMAAIRSVITSFLELSKAEWNNEL